MTVTRGGFNQNAPKMGVADFSSEDSRCTRPLWLRAAQRPATRRRQPAATRSRQPKDKNYAEICEFSLRFDDPLNSSVVGRLLHLLQSLIEAEAARFCTRRKVSEAL